MVRVIQLQAADANACEGVWRGRDGGSRHNTSGVEGGMHWGEMGRCHAWGGLAALLWGMCSECQDDYDGCDSTWLARLTFLSQASRRASIVDGRQTPTPVSMMAARQCWQVRKREDHDASFPGR